VKILLLDADNLINRAFYAIPESRSQDGTPTNALRGFSNTLLNLRDQCNADLTVCAFDSGTPPFRKEAAPSYKANRGEKPEELAEQLQICKHILCKVLGASTVHREKTEADDILYTLTLRAREKNHEVWIASGDKDTVQCLVDKETTMLRPPQKPSMPWSVIPFEQASSLFGVPPHLIPDYLAIVGDAVDNLPGVPGAGPKTASKWVQEWGGVHEILKNVAKLKPERLQPAVTPELLLKNLIVTKAYDTGDTLPLHRSPSPPDAAEYLHSLGLHKIANRI
jgi:DNA polymerase-1